MLSQLECVLLGSIPDGKPPWDPPAIALISQVNSKRRDSGPAFQILGFTGIIQASCGLGLPTVLGEGMVVWRLLGTEHGQQQEGGGVLSVGVKNSEMQIGASLLVICSMNLSSLHTAAPWSSASHTHSAHKASELWFCTVFG